MTARDGVTGPLQWAMINVSLTGQLVSGDCHVVVPTADGALVAVIDGLGHGTQAADAAFTAASILEGDPSLSVEDALLACHRELARTRGAVMSVVHVRSHRLTWAGVGNVEAVVARPPWGTAMWARLTPVSGIVGYGLPTVRSTDIRIAPGDILVLCTDGLRADFTDCIDPASSPKRIVERLMSERRTGRDDALVLAARYDGEET